MAPYISNADSKKRLQSSMKRVEQSLAPVARVRRRLNAGRPSPSERDLNALQALARITAELDKARGLMRDEGLAPDDIHAALVFALPESRQVGHRWLPKPGDPLAEYFAGIEGHGPNTLFLGILWAQRDRAQPPGSQWFGWVSPFTKDERDHDLLAFARDKAAEEAAKLNAAA